MKWIMPEHPRIDRIACPWLIENFIDAEADYLYVVASEVRKIAADPVMRAVRHLAGIAGVVSQQPLAGTPVAFK
jgi:hypothetical protein